MKTILLPIILSALCGPALAQCPSREDLSRGIRFTLDTGETETFRDIGEGVVETMFQSDALPPVRVLLAQGIYLLEIIDIEDGKPQPATRATYSYRMRPADMPMPAPGDTWQTEAAVLDQGELGRETQTYLFGTPQEVRFGPCRYSMLPVSIAFDGTSGITLETVHYLPDLGLSYVAASETEGQVDTYRYIAISALP